MFEAATAEEDLVREARGREREPLRRRALLTELFVGGLFLAAAVALAVLADAERDFRAGPAIALAVMFALGVSIRIEVGGSYTSPVQLAFVPMLFLLPTPLVPLIVAAAWFVGNLPEVLARRVHPDRLAHSAANAWFALGPALVLVAFDAQVPDWADWPVYLLALAAQFAADVAISTLREFLAEGTPPRLQLQVLADVQGIDALLSPLGLLAAFASASFDYAFLLLIPPIALLTVYARERSGRLSAALALGDAARDRQALIASASHELVTPMAVLVGLTERLASGRALAPERRAQLDAVMHRETLALRQLVRQFVDYTRLKSERELDLEIAPVDVGALAATIAPTSVPHDLPPVLADADRLHQMLTSFATDVVRGVPEPARAAISATHADGAVTIAVSGPAEPRREPFAEAGDSSDIALYVSAELARLLGGTVGLTEEPGGGSRYTLVLSAA